MGRSRRSNKRGRSSGGDVYLPEEIIEQIIVKLPVKSIIRFQIVSKSYLNLIKSSAFINKHLLENKEILFTHCYVPWVDKYFGAKYEDADADVDRLYLSLCSYNQHKQTSYTWPVLDLQLPIPRNLIMVDQINGIICFTDYVNVILINPSLAEVKWQPTLLPPVEEGNRLSLVGFGFHNMTMDFKVVTLRHVHDDDGEFIRQRGEVYSLRSNSWRVLDEMPFQCHDMSRHDRSHCSIFFNGVIYWYVKTLNTLGQTFLQILTFNLDTDLFQHMEIPQDCLISWTTILTLFVLNQESLALLTYENHIPRTCAFVNVWTMNKHEQTWTKLYSFGPLAHLYEPISFLNKHKFLYRTELNQLILYDILNHSKSVVCEPSQFQPAADSLGFTHRLKMGVCRSSLVSLNM